LRKEIIIASRGSKLALVQAEWVKEKLEGFYPGIDFIINKIKTSGDMITGMPLPKIGTKGLFTKEIEESLLRKESHIAVHSMKDLPTDIPPGLIIGAITIREDPHDCLISRGGVKLSDLPQGAKLGTSSLRRSSQLLIFRPDFRVISIRGNLTTRLTKLYEEDLNAIIVALAGVRRLGLEDRITEIIPFEILMPAVGQGALGIEVREDDKDVIEMVRHLDDETSRPTIEAERAFLKKMGGGCQVPMGAMGEIIGEKLRLAGIVSSTDGKRVLRFSVTGDKNDYKAIGEKLALELISKGADGILNETKNAI
jgi:hydroxymethylbilane synthase